MRIGLFGAGKVGTAIARRALEAGHEVRVVGSPRQDALTLDLIVGSVAPGAVVSDATSVAAWADVLLLAVPFSRSADLPYELFDGRVVVDLMNHWEPVDGPAPELSGAGTTEVVAARNPRARWVKSLNHLGYHDVETDALPAGSAGRRAVGVATDDAAAGALVARLVDSLGFDPVDLGPLRTGRVLEAGGPVFGTYLTADDLGAMVGAEAAA
ncbi:NADPH-dependent F420 reductase [Antribacter gilvus]|uniref:NADPH-dependent F420 reductase n=1 Tax=Antribacter gilvus TaxID=2304675 RepID=UPI000F78EB65|nr:NAD(P)-binding domain-containing protein [Antribacter gilvus]